MIFPFNNRGVLGLNARNLLYIKPFNPRKAVAFADDKMKTKSFLSARGIPTAKVFARIESRRQLKNFDFDTLPDECVLKPNYGFGGEGIMILDGRKNGQFLEQGRRIVTREELVEHIENILDGTFSVNGRADSAFFEQILVAHDCFTPFRPAGLPDIRIIVFNLVPVMAMLRIPTGVSRGKANVHLGGIGIGIDIAKGVTTYAAQYDAVLKELAHGMPVGGLEIPYWEEMLLIASKIQYTTNIGYLAVDLTIDRTLGPVLLEVNARAGLTVQVANLAPLRSRLERVEGLSVSTPEKGVRIAQELFGEKVERSGQPQPEKEILGTREIIEISGAGVTIEEASAVSPERDETIFTDAFLQELIGLKAIEPMDGKRTFRVKFTLGGRKIQTIAHAGILPGGLRASIGNRDLKGFLIDPSRSRLTVPHAGIRKDLRSIDRILAAADRELMLLKYLRPTNLNEERERLNTDLSYNPVFQYRACPELAEIEQTVRKVESDQSPLGILLRKKQRELLLKAELIRSRGDAQKFTAASLALYGNPSPALIGFAKEHLSSRIASDMPPKIADQLTAEEAKPEFEKFLRGYDLHDWTVELKKGMVADCAAGEKRVFLRSGATFTKQHLTALFAHEIEAHVLTSENGRIQPYELFRRGFANYLDTQEGLAIFNQNRVLPPYHEKRFLYAKRVLAAAFAMDHSFAEIRAYVNRELGIPAEKSLTMAIDLKRGFTRTAEPGAFTKSLVYFRGLRAIDQFVRLGGDLKQLYIGKIAIEDLALLHAIDGVRPPLILPFFLRTAPEKPKKERKKTKKQ